MFIYKIKNSPIISNCYILYSDSKCIIVDPGSSSNIEILEFLKLNNLSPEYIFLTHEHFDHIWGLNDLKSIFLDLEIVTFIVSYNSSINDSKLRVVTLGMT